MRFSNACNVRVFVAEMFICLQQLKQAVRLKYLNKDAGVIY